ncbi:MAG TPA: hypothetical protein VM639_11250 [Dongiaceae bacterium]|nr:hypothetical protein [Dongiaceae bacterium]
MIRRLSFAAVMAAGVLFGLGQASQAATVTQDLGTLTAVSTSAAFGTEVSGQPNFTLDNAGNGTLHIDFSLGTAAKNLAASLTASSFGAVALKTFTFGLYDSANTLLTQVDQTTASYPNGATTFSFLDFANVLKKGAYYLLLDVTSGAPGQKISGNLQISAVPVPAALPMFGVALVGLAAFRFRRRNRAEA